MLSNESSTLKALEKIAEELELANRLKMFEIMIIGHGMLPKNYDKYNVLVAEFEEKLGTKEKR